MSRPKSNCKTIFVETEIARGGHFGDARDMAELALERRAATVAPWFGGLPREGLPIRKSWIIHCGSGDTGRSPTAKSPARDIADVKSVVATGRLINGARSSFYGAPGA